MEVIFHCSSSSFHNFVHSGLIPLGGMIEDDQVQDQDDQEEDPSGCALDLATNGVEVNDEALMEGI